MANVPTTAHSETTPDGSIIAASLIDDYIREFKTQAREIIAADHTMSSSGQGSTWGMHKIIRLLVQTSITELANAGCLYAKDVDSKAELHFKDEDNNEKQITSKGVIKVVETSAPSTLSNGHVWVE